MPIDPKRLARVRAHLLTAAAITTAGCAGEPVHVNEPPPQEPVHINQPPQEPPPAAPTAEPAPSAAPTTADTAPSAAPSATPGGPRQPYTINKPRSDK